MFHKIISTMGLGILGIDPITAIVILSMGLKKDKKSKISLFVFSFMFSSIIIGALISVLFGTTALDYINSIMPSDASPFWAYLEFSISIIILIWLFIKFINRNKTKENKKEKDISGAYIKYFLTGFVFALTCFTDPTYYAVILLGSETNSIILSTVLILLWFVISQFMTLIVYLSIQFNFLNKVTNFINKYQNRNKKKIDTIIYIIFTIIALILLFDSGYYLITGNYLF